MNKKYYVNILYLLIWIPVFTGMTSKKRNDNLKSVWKFKKGNDNFMKGNKKV